MLKKFSNDNSAHLSPHLVWLILGVTFVFGLFFILSTFVPVSQSALNDKITGWGWSPITSSGAGPYYFGYGLTSFNDCYWVYDQINPICLSEWNTIPRPAPYGLNIDFSNKEITGWVWNQGVGWICFGNSCCTAGGGQNYCTSGTPDGSQVKVTYDDTQNPSPISGWAKIIAATSSVAWGDNGWISLRGTTTQAPVSEYGLTFSTTTLEIKGLAWNGFTDTGGVPAGGNMQPYHGYGWFCINATSTWGGEYDLCKGTQVTVTIPFIQTVDGDVYSQTNILPDLKPPAGRFNATYLILAGGNIANFTSEEKNITLPAGSYTQPSFPYPLSLPKASTNYFNALGYLDVPGISYLGTNKYGPQESFTGNIYINGAYTKPGYRVIINAGDLVLGKDSPVVFGAGATTFIIDGDLIISGNVSYSQTAVTDFSLLPAVAYIVRGDVLISPSVTEIAGNFIVIGADNVNCDTPGCGIIDTVNPGDSDDGFTLTVHGIMMAKKFKFQRAYASVLNEPAEKVIYDGRLLVNPPPGLADFAKGLPIWSETPPQ
jgi:hypothetical protein